LPKERPSEKERSGEGWTAAEVIEQFASYVVGPAHERLVGRLLWLEQLGLVHLVVNKKQAAQQEWRQQQGCQPTKPCRVSLRSSA
jgi:hypothetical protein